MELCEINPFMRFAQLQPSVLEGESLRAAYDNRLFYALDGSAILKTAHAERPLIPGNVLFVRPGTPYSFVGKMKIIVLNFDLTQAFAAFRRPMLPSPLSAFSPEDIREKQSPAMLGNMLCLDDTGEIEPLFRECAAQFDFQTPLSDAVCSAHIKTILCRMLQKEPDALAASVALIQKALHYIRTNYDKDIQNADIGAALGYHPYYLNRVLKAGTGMTLHQILLSTRLKHAKALLRQTGLSVDAIAEEVGFRDRPQFCTVFRKATGMTPTAYRNHSGKGPV